MVLKHLLNILFPPKCILCCKILDKNEGICQNCKKNAPYLTKTDRKTKVSHLEGVISLFKYESDIKASIRRFKFSKRKSYAFFYASLLSDLINEYKLKSYDGVVWVPISKKRLKKRGYDQSRLIAFEMSKNLNTRLFENTLVKIKENKPQSSLKEKYRRANVIGVYSIKNREEIRQKTIILVDDIITTGATLSECAKMLKIAGAKEVYGVTLAKTIKN